MLLLLLLLSADAPLCTSQWDVGVCDDACFSGDDRACLDAGRIWQKVAPDDLAAVLAADRYRRACARGAKHACNSFGQAQRDVGDGTAALATWGSACSAGDDIGCLSLTELLNETGYDKKLVFPAEREVWRARLAAECPQRNRACISALDLDDDDARKRALQKTWIEHLLPLCTQGDLDPCLTLTQQRELVVHSANRLDAIAKTLRARCEKATDRACRVLAAEESRLAYDVERRAWADALCAVGRKGACDAITAQKKRTELQAQANTCWDKSAPSSRRLPACRVIAALEPPGEAVRDALDILCDAKEVAACDRRFRLRAAEEDGAAWYVVDNACRDGVAVACRAQKLQDTTPRSLEIAARTPPKDARRPAPDLAIATLAEGEGAGTVALLVWWRFEGGRQVGDAVSAPTSTPLFTSLAQQLKPGERARVFTTDAVVLEVVAVGEK